MNSKTKKGSLYRYIGVVYGLIFVLSILLICSIIIYVNYNNQKNSSLSLSKEIVTARAQELGEWLGAFITESKIIASNSIIMSSNKDLIKNELILIAKNFDESHEAASFIDLNGNFLTDKGVTGNVVTREYFKEVIINKKEYYVSNPVISKVSNELISPVAYRVLNENDELVGMYMEPIRLNYLAEVISSIKIGEKGEAWIVDRTGLMMAHPNKDLISKLNVLESDKIGYKGLAEAGQEMIQQKSGNKIITKPDGTRHFLIYASIPNSMGWTMGITISIHDMLKDSITSIKIAAIISAVLLTIVIFLTLLIAGSIVRPIRLISKIAKELSLGNIGLKGIENKTKQNLLKRNDEIRETAESMNELIDYIREKEEIAKKMSDNDFSITPKVVSDTDDFGFSYNNLVKSLNGTLLNIMKNVEQVNSGANQVAQASQSLSQGATEQASSLEEITSSITEINSQAKQNAGNATQASELAKLSMGNAKNGNVQMRELVIAMGEINKSADEIKRIVKVIDDIAFQTNLLALNANVEAARAGKYGKGFAVVAEEVRNLASRSAESVKETTEMVDKSIKNISSGNELVEVTAKQLEEIMESASKVSDLVQEIASASKEQTLGLDQINQGLSQIDQVTQSNTASAEESASAAEELASQAQELKNLVDKFKINENNSKFDDMHNSDIKELESPPDAII